METLKSLAVGILAFSVLLFIFYLIWYGGYYIVPILLLIGFVWGLVAIGKDIREYVNDVRKG